MGVTRMGGLSRSLGMTPTSRLFCIRDKDFGLAQERTKMNNVFSRACETQVTAVLLGCGRHRRHGPSTSLNTKAAAVSKPLCPYATFRSHMET